MYQFTQKELKEAFKDVGGDSIEIMKWFSKNPSTNIKEEKSKVIAEYSPLIYNVELPLLNKFLEDNELAELSFRYKEVSVENIVFELLTYIAKYEEYIDNMNTVLESELHSFYLDEIVKVEKIIEEIENSRFKAFINDWE